MFTEFYKDLHRNPWWSLNHSKIFLFYLDQKPPIYHVNVFSYVLKYNPKYALLRLCFKHSQLALLQPFCFYSIFPRLNLYVLFKFLSNCELLVAAEDFLVTIVLLKKTPLLYPYKIFYHGTRGGKTFLM